MATTEHARHQLYRRLIDTIGPDEADTLMEFLPPSGWADVTTKTDLAHHTAMTNARFDQFTADTNARFDQFTADTNARFAETNARIDALDARTDARFDRLEGIIHTQAQVFDARLSTEISGVRIELADLRTELHRSLRLHTLVTVGVLGTLISVVGILTGGG